MANIEFLWKKLFGALPLVLCGIMLGAILVGSVCADKIDRVQIQAVGLALLIEANNR